MEGSIKLVLMNTLKINKSKILIFLSIVIFLKPSNVAYWSMVDNIYKVFKLLMMIILGVNYIRNDVKIKKNDFLFLAILIIWLISTFRNLHSFGNNLQQVLSIVCLYLLVRTIKSRAEMLSFFESISFIAKVYVTLELITIILGHPIFADAMDRTDKYFLGNDNYSAFVIIPLCGLMMANSLIVNKKIDFKTWFFMLIAYLCFLVPGSVTAIVAFGILIILAMFINWTWLRKLLRLRNVIIAAIVFVVLVVGFNIQDHMGALLSFVGKNALNAREIIWPRAVMLFLKRPLFGWGALTENQIEGYVLYGTTHAHNIILQLLLDIGIIGTIVFFIWLYRVLRNNVKIKKKYMYIIQACIACYVFAAIFDFYFGLIYFWLLVFSYELIGRFEVERTPIKTN